MRLVDVNGQLINPPKGYWAAERAIKEMIDGMNKEEADRSDMRVVVQDLFKEASFHMTFLPKRDSTLEGKAN